MALIPVGGGTTSLSLDSSRFSTGGITSLSYNFSLVPAGGERRSFSPNTYWFPTRKESRELPPHPFDTKNTLTNEAASFIREFFKREPSMREIVRNFRRTATEVKEKFGQADKARTTGAVVGGAGLTALGVGVAADLLTGGLGAAAGLLTGGIGTVVAAAAAAAGVLTVGGVSVVKRRVKNNQTEMAKYLGNKLMKIVKKLMEKVKKIKTTCQKKKTRPVHLLLREEEDLESEVEELEREVEELEREVEELERDVEELERKSEEERKREELEKKREELERKREQLERKRKELEIKKRELERKREELERKREAEERKREELERKKKVEELEREVKELEETLTDLKKVPEESPVTAVYSFLTMEHMQSFLQNIFRGSPTAEQDEELTESITQLAKQGKKVTDKFREISQKLEG